MNVARWLRRSGALPAPDFLRPVRRPGALVWLLCASVTAAALLAAIDAHSVMQQRDAAVRALEAAQARVQQARQSQQVQQAQPTAAGSGPGARTRRTDPGANANLRLPVQRSLLLARPWLDELSGVEQAAVGGLRWLTLDMGAQGQLQLEAEAATATAAVLATQSLQRHGHWADVSLRRVEQGPAAAAPGAGIRFQIAATGLSETAAAPR